VAIERCSANDGTFCRTSCTIYDFFPLGLHKKHRLCAYIRPLTKVLGGLKNRHFLKSDGSFVGTPTYNHSPYRCTSFPFFGNARVFIFLFLNEYIHTYVCINDSFSTRSRTKLLGYNQSTGRPSDYKTARIYGRLSTRIRFGVPVRLVTARLIIVVYSIASYRKFPVNSACNRRKLQTRFFRTLETDATQFERCRKYYYFFSRSLNWHF